MFAYNNNEKLVKERIGTSPANSAATRSNASTARFTLSAVLSPMSPAIARRSWLEQSFGRL
jgi:hypothetical protein